MRRHHHIFEKIIKSATDLPPAVTAVVYPLSDVALEGAVEAAEEKLIEPIFIGPAEEIKALAQNCKLAIDQSKIIDIEDDLKAASKGVEICRKGIATALMKGSLHTDHFMHAVLRDDTGLKTHQRISHAFVFDVPTYPRTLIITDAAINIYPNLVDKVDIVQNAIDLAHDIGIETPKVAILSAVETVTPTILSTIDAAALCKMAERGQITGGILDGPLAFDNAVNLKAAEIKRIHSPVAGKADILVVPDLESGNMLAKQLEYLAEAEAAGIVVGARVPIVLTSRADSPKCRLASCAVAALLAHARHNKDGKSLGAAN